MGLSEGGTPSYSPASLADDAHDLIQALQLKDAVIVGWSLGGMAARVRRALQRRGEPCGTDRHHAPGPECQGRRTAFL